MLLVNIELYVTKNPSYHNAQNTVLNEKGKCVIITTG